ncbi:MAG: hypothetical protein CBC27_01010 [Opitutia bacterium TMED67]|mgnify:FL=1|jgi:hypothetical protein|nr:hypothetical protein [Verrucomicrobiales bacterium]OUU77003.1 MAG: hypothetical protein CBC27_01010 [Opitutae bacterium TMED67]
MPYKIIGSDSKEYSPVELEEIREWIREGRADSNTLVCEIGETQWVRLRDVSIFSGDLLKDRKDRSDRVIQINYLVPAILCTIFCCLPFGIAGILFAAQANSKTQQGDYDGANIAASRAKQMCILSFVCGILYIIYVFSSGEFQRIMEAVQEVSPR